MHGSAQYSKVLRDSGFSYLGEMGKGKGRKEKGKGRREKGEGRREEGEKGEGREGRREKRVERDVHKMCTRRATTFTNVQKRAETVTEMCQKCEINCTDWESNPGWHTLRSAVLPLNYPFRYRYSENFTHPEPRKRVKKVENVPKSCGKRVENVRKTYQKRVKNVRKLCKQRVQHVWKTCSTHATTV